MQFLKRFLSFHQLSSFRLRKTMLDSSGNLNAVFCEPLLLLVQHTDGALHELLRGFVGTALNITLNKGFQFGF